MNSCKILVVEDDPSIRRVIMVALKRDGYTNIEEVTDGNEAVDMAFRFRPDLVLLDIMLPGMDGMSVCRELRANPETKSAAAWRDSRTSVTLCTPHRPNCMLTSLQCRLLSFC